MIKNTRMVIVVCFAFISGLFGCSTFHHRYMGTVVNICPDTGTEHIQALFDHGWRVESVLHGNDGCTPVLFTRVSVTQVFHETPGTCGRLDQRPCGEVRGVQSDAEYAEQLRQERQRGSE
jgi:hypothetical protein